MGPDWVMIGSVAAVVVSVVILVFLVIRIGRLINKTHSED